MSKSEHKTLVTQLRKNGSSIFEIVSKTGISKSTVSHWCREVKLNKNQKERLFNKMIQAGHRGRLIGVAVNHQKKEDSIQLCKEWAKNVLSIITERDMFIAGIALYWSEGSKSTYGNLSFVNSDSKMIIFMINWFKKYFEVSPDDFILRVSINETHRDRNDVILNYWSNLLELPKSSFRKTTFTKAPQRKVYENHDTYYGLLVIRIRRSTIIIYKILALNELIRMPA